MSALGWAAQHRLLLVGTGILVLIGLAAAGVWFFILQSPGTQVSLRQAIRTYRQDQTSAKTDNEADLPASGVYRYRTTGGEHLSFGGVSRQFPASSEMIVTDQHGCATMKWEPLVQHMEGLVVCPGPDGALKIASTSSYEEIVGIVTKSVVRCPAGTYLVPPNAKPGDHWRTTCHGTHDEQVVFSGRVVGKATVDVGRHRDQAIHTHLTLQFSGAESGTNPNDYWVTAGTGLILRQDETVAVAQQAGPLGSVHYTEQMGIALEAAAPTR